MAGAYSGAASPAARSEAVGETERPGDIGITMPRVLKEKGLAYTLARSGAARPGRARIFLSRCVFGELAPWVNLSSGAAHYPWLRFVLWSVLGDAVWVGMYVTLGRLFSGRVQALADLVGSVGGLLLGVLVAAVAGWLLLRHVRRATA